MKLQITQAYNRIMEYGKMVRLPGHVPAPADVGLWKLKIEYTVDHVRINLKWCYCPMAYCFGCQCQIKLFDGPQYTALHVRGKHDADSHAPDKEKSKNLMVNQIQAIATGVLMALNQSARLLQHNLTNFSDDVQIDNVKVWHMRRKAEHKKLLTMEQLDNYKIDDSYGSPFRCSEAKLFETHLGQHNDEDANFHFNLIETFVSGWDFNSKDDNHDIVYLNFSTIWHLCNFLHNLAAGWLMQIKGDATYKVCLCRVAIYSISVNSIPQVNNLVCFAVIPLSESKQVIQGTFRATQTAVFMLRKQYRVCEKEGRRACASAGQLRSTCMRFYADGSGLH